MDAPLTAADREELARSMVADVLRWASIQSGRHPDVDYEAAALDGLANAALAWEPERANGMSFRTFAIFAVRSYCRNEWHKVRARRHVWVQVGGPGRADDRTRSEAETLTWVPSRDPSPLRQLALREEAETALAGFPDWLADGFRRGLGRAELARERGVSFQAVDSAIKRARRQLDGTARERGWQRGRPRRPLITTNEE